MKKTKNVAVSVIVFLMGITGLMSSTAYARISLKGLPKWTEFYIMQQYKLRLAQWSQRQFNQTLFLPEQPKNNKNPLRLSYKKVQAQKLHDQKKLNNIQTFLNNARKQYQENPQAKKFWLVGHSYNLTQFSAQVTYLHQQELALLSSLEMLSEAKEEIISAWYRAISYEEQLASQEVRLSVAQSLYEVQKILSAMEQEPDYVGNDKVRRPTATLRTVDELIKDATDEP